MGVMEPCSAQLSWRLAGGREGDRSLKSQAPELGLHLQVVGGAGCLRKPSLPSSPAAPVSHAAGSFVFRT